MRESGYALLGERIETARPRLLRLAQLNGIGLDEAEDVVQETYIEAWRNLDKLREPERFSAWLDGICRNICKRHLHARAASLEMQELSQREDNPDTEPFDLPDPLAIDPVEELERQDRQALLDRALGYLPANTRELITLCYLAEVPQREVAEQLQMSLGALELKLHRARRQLRQVLQGELRDSARAFGMLLNDDEATGWQETRQWCWICGKQRLHGTFERQDTGIIAFRMRCPDCSPEYGIDIVHTGKSPLILPTVGALRSFRPALKRTLLAGADYMSTMLNQRRCNRCQTPVQIEITDRDTLHAQGSAYNKWPQNLYLQVTCPNCGRYILEFFSVLLTDQDARAFILDRPRVVTTATMMDTYAGQDVLRSCLRDLTSGAQLSIMTHPRTFAVLATALEA